jgi:hypothetical protein
VFISFELIEYDSNPTTVDQNMIPESTPSHLKEGCFKVGDPIIHEPKLCRELTLAMFD